MCEEESVVRSGIPRSGVIERCENIRDKGRDVGITVTVTDGHRRWRPVCSGGILAERAMLIDALGFSGTGR